MTGFESRSRASSVTAASASSSAGPSSSTSNRLPCLTPRTCPNPRRRHALAMASPCGSCISGLSITSTIIRATYPPGSSGHISSGEERPTGIRDTCRPTGHAAYATAPRQRSPGTSSRRAGAGDPRPGPGKEWHVTVESGAATTAASVLDQPAPDTPDQAGEFIQLLTPDGERIDPPDYPLDLSAEEIRG